MYTRVGADVLIRNLIKIIPEDQTNFRDSLTKLSDGWWNKAP